jgi:hypothetical protein
MDLEAWPQSTHRQLFATNITDIIYMTEVESKSGLQPSPSTVQYSTVRVTTQLMIGNLSQIVLSHLKLHFVPLAGKFSRRGYCERSERTPSAKG